MSTVHAVLVIGSGKWSRERLEPVGRRRRAATAQSGERIGLIVRGGVNRANWSGIPAGLLRGLGECGYEVSVCNSEISMGTYRLLQVYFRATRRPEEQWFVAPEMMKLRELSAGRRRRRLPRVNGWIVLGSESGAPAKGPFVTFDDMTVGQAQQHPWYFPPYPARSWAHWRANQAKLYRRATRCFAGTAWAAQSICDEYGIAANKVEVLGFGRNLEVSAPASRDWSAPRFLFVGTDWDRKNGPAVLEAFTRIRRQVQSAQLSVVGKHPPLDRPGVVGYGRLKLDSADGRQMLAKLFTSSTCLVLPSYLEPFGIAYAEAAAAGLAVIGTTVGGAREVVGPTGVCVDPTDTDGIERAMRRMADPAVAMRYGSAGPAHARRYRWVSIAARMAQALPPRQTGGPFSSPRSVF